MKWRWIFAVVPLAMSATFIPSSNSPAADKMHVQPMHDRNPAQLSILDYNIKGLPWPIATGRASALAMIGERLASLRRSGKQPHLVLLQEAFTSDARAIGAIGGYRFMAAGPQSDSAPGSGSAPLGKQFAQGSSWFKGETEGKWIDSGLLLLSDYPITAIKRYAFPQGACAGFDCLAAKGVLLAWIKVPGVSQPVAVATTHFNSRRHSGVSPVRADRAFGWQLDAARTFVEDNVSRDKPVIFAGDFNFGHTPGRQRLIQTEGLPLSHADEALRLAKAGGLVASEDERDASAIIAKGTDREYFRSGDRIRLALSNVTVPFGTEANNTQLSDHKGFVTEYRISELRSSPSPADTTH